LMPKMKISLAFSRSMMCGWQLSKSEPVLPAQRSGMRVGILSYIRVNPNFGSSDPPHESRWADVSNSQLARVEGFAHLYNILSTAQLALGFFVCRSLYVDRCTTITLRTSRYDDLWTGAACCIAWQGVPTV
jgi:hypothetical protein